MIAKIGFFHFGTNHFDPVGSLQLALSAARQNDDISRSLIVLPEGMNIRRPYRDSGKCNTSPAIVSELRKTARQFQVTFVAGLILGDHGTSEHYSSAYLVGDEHCELLCHKAENDGSENYACCTGNPDIKNPIRFDDLDIATIICVDIQNSQRWRTLLEEHESERIVVCIPACMGPAFFSAGRLGHQVSVVHGTTVPIVLANSDPGGCSSFLTNRDGIITHCHTGIENKVVVARLQFEPLAS